MVLLNLMVVLGFFATPQSLSLLAQLWKFLMSHLVLLFIQYEHALAGLRMSLEIPITLNNQNTVGVYSTYFLCA